MKDWIANVLSHPELTRMGHHQRVEDANLGLGWIYYGLARSLRPATVVVIGSWRGFAPLMFAKALTDNTEGGEVIFIDPSLVDDFWRDAENVRDWFAGFGIHNVRHYRMTTQEFTATEDYRALANAGIVFVDGHHSLEQVSIDYDAFRSRLAPDGVMLFHDSLRVRTSDIYGKDKVYLQQVRTFVDELQKIPGVQVFDLPCGDGLTLVRATT